MPTLPIVFHTGQYPGVLRERLRLKKQLMKLFRKEGRKLSDLHFIFCSDAELLEINRQWLKHDYFTDIISFDLAAAGEPAQGEIYISVDRIRENARSYGTTLKEEIHRVIFHGSLHLCGYADKTPAEQKRMRKKEDQWLDDYFLNHVPRKTVSN